MKERKLYRRSQGAKVLGVAKGISEYVDVHPFFIRFALALPPIIGFVLSIVNDMNMMYSLVFGGFAFLFYMVLAIILRNKDTLYKKNRLRDFDSFKDYMRYHIRRFSFKKFVISLLAYSWLIVMVIIVLAPVLWMVNVAFTDATQLADVPIYPKFSEWTLVNYEELFTYKSSSTAVLPDYVDSFLTTAKIAVLNTVLVVTFSSLVGFSFSRYNFKGKKKVLLTLMALQMFPSFMGMLALFMFFRQFGLLNNWVALTMIYVAGSIPYNTFIVRGFMRNIPKSLDEAAMIDGASNLQVMRKIIIPLAVPIMGFIAVTAFMGPWLDYILPSVIMPQKQTVAVWLFRYMDPLSHEYDRVQFMAGALFLAVPIMMVQIYMQRFVVYGLTAGAEKG